ncbi:hypothetical protein [Natrialba sp. INN-245]|uniref:hypothetical protein n=1 Tax=Natrialba sp. INN-245 TaxID=2690967 RepID=UPI001310B039|nr:hypothetical protein [Natrialba sp. INN-245]MWV38593.1 hypothetical protein [Natrialba sp. INN-245]
MADDPIDGQVLLLTAAKASVPPSRLPALVERAQALLEGDLERYRRSHERVYAAADREAFLVDEGHWERLGERMGVDDRERSAIQRAHEEQFRRIGRHTDRKAEFESSLEIRKPVLVGVGEREPAEESAQHGQ